MAVILVLGLLLTLTTALKNPPLLGQEARALLRSLQSANISPLELKLRGRLFLRAEREARKHNSDASREFNMGINKFSVMTTQEKQLYLGLTNDTYDISEDEPVNHVTTGRLLATPSSVSHRDQGHVTAVKDQSSCGSCWAFAGVGAFEGSYSAATGVLKSFSEKEAMDCSYPEEKDGCEGGWYSAVWRYVAASGRLGNMRDIPYFPSVDTCNRWDGKPNGIRNAEFIGYYSGVGSLLERVVSIYTPAAAMTVEDDFFAYRDGVYSGCANPDRVNHGVVLVGYTPSYWEVKNSWGADWGDKGFARITRSRDNVCRVTSRVQYPVVIGRDKGEKDEPDSLPEDELVEVSRGLSVLTSDGSTSLLATDGDTSTCITTSQSSNPFFKLHLSSPARVQKIELITPRTDSSHLIGSKLHVGNRGNFFDKRVGEIKEVSDEGRVVFELEQGVEGEWVFWEFYRGGQVRGLSVCEIRVLGGGEEEGENNGCSGGTVRCSDGVCRHAHMC